MTQSQVAYSMRTRNPDVLSCIANLSNDEVFTPPELANQMLDALARGWADANDSANIWADSSVTFLDPFSKSGVFLREVTKRLVDGLAEEMPDLQERVDHILTKQIFGIGITQICAYLARRSLYCSKDATGEHSIAQSFTHPDGNIWFDRSEHTWAGGTEWVHTADDDGNPAKRSTNGRCRYCGTSQKTLDRSKGLESHAYAFIHTDNIKLRLIEMFGVEMQFDVIIGNPPYQLSDGGQGASALPIYNLFVEQAKALQPRFLNMIIPARWFFGGRGLDVFRKSMLEDRRTRTIVDFPDSRQAFSTVDVAGGVCYFLWDRDNEGDCTVISHGTGGKVTSVTRPLLEKGASVFVRNNDALAIMRKVVAMETGSDGVVLPPSKRFEQRVSGQKPFGLRTYFRGSDARRNATDLVVLQAGGRAWASPTEITEGLHMIDKWKAFTSKSSSEHAGQADKNGMRRVLSMTGVLAPGSVCTETYVILGSFDTEAEANNCLSYALTRFFRFMVATRTSAQDLPRAAYSFVPDLDYSRAWTDEDLYARYDLNRDEVALIESSIKLMNSEASK
ncbi:Eco57I restriction-modification methylase domain-containing protein [Rhodococcoides fascians]|uniref:Eco57I restriction-modification methylase domain-containing protein n=1 Tax=Rhodococcoides fascians TaxID=1828 RepID=UPI0005699CC6|nr:MULTISPECIES: Eco57I restriction-modification methylase domain-containing protein [Rhodococcus]OZE96559.1 restriction endonuclease [Rhodococcus sp. 15-1189-1-1a]OZF11606.1 restriction endonuclease [Rhodococcus sp. 14-2686-1-2]